jgi:glycosyltransferase 2 family protein
MTTLRIGIVGFFYNTFLPGAVGGDIVKAAAVAREQRRRATAVATVIMDRVIGLWSLVSFAALLGGLCWAVGMLDGAAARSAQAIVLGAATVVGLSLAAWVLVGLVAGKTRAAIGNSLRRIPRIGGAAVEFWHVLDVYRRGHRSVGLAVGLSWMSNAACVLSFYCCALTLWDGRADNPLPTLAQYFLIVPLGQLIAAIPLFPGGAGINEAGFGGLFALFGSAAANGILAALVNRVIVWIIGLAGYLCCQCLSADFATPPDAGTADRVEPATADGLA